MKKNNKSPSKISPLERGLRDVSYVLKLLDTTETLIHKIGLSNDKFIINSEYHDISIKINDIQVISTNEKGLLFRDSYGNSYQSVPSLTLAKVEKLFSEYPQFIRTHESFIVNFNHLDYFSPSDTDSGGRTLTMKKTNISVPLSSTNSKKVKDYFSIKSLEHVEPWNIRYSVIINENLRNFDKEIRFMSSEELKLNFHFKATGEFNIREFIANMIWEYYNLLINGKRDPIEGNIRTFWYYLKPTLSKAVNINSQSQYGIMIDTFRELIVTHKLFKYKDFGFISDSEANYSIGASHPNIILVGEKAGHLKKLKRLQDEFGVTLAVLGGMPSILSTEYLVDELEKKFDISVKPVHIITLVDYNPSSSIIYQSFISQLIHEGIENISSVYHILTHDSFSKDELPHVTDQIPVTSPADKTKLNKWMSAGNGVDLGDGIKLPLGIESEALILDSDKLKNLFIKFFEMIIKSNTSENNFKIDSKFIKKFWTFE